MSTETTVDLAEWKWENNEDGISIVGYKGKSEYVSVPAEIKGQLVTEIGYVAFKNSYLKSVVLPHGLKRIDMNAFSHCTELRSVDFPNGLEEIGEYAFQGCTYLEEIVIPKGVKLTKGGAFQNCTNLKRIILMEKATVIGGTFGGCYHIEEITVHTSVKIIFSHHSDYGFSLFDNPIDPSCGRALNHKKITALGNNSAICVIEKSEIEAMFPKDECNDMILTLRRYGLFQGHSANSAKFADIVRQQIVNGNMAIIKIYGAMEMIHPKRIDDYIVHATNSENQAAVDFFSQLKKNDSNLKKSTKSLSEKNANSETIVALKKLWHFQNGTDGGVSIDKYKGTDTAVIVPEIIGKKAVTVVSGFENCIDIIEVHLPKNLKKIDAAAFKGCINLAEIILPVGLEEIDASAFQYCKKLTEIHIPNNIREVSNQTFEGCTDLVHIHLPPDITTIGTAAFKGCRRVKHINVPLGLESIQAGAFEECAELTHIKLPDGLKEIGMNAFKHCTELTEITIPNSVKSIGFDAFFGCTQLTKVFFLGDTTAIGKNSFALVDNTQFLSSISRVEFHSDLMIYAPIGSLAETYAKINNIQFVEI